MTANSTPKALPILIGAAVTMSLAMGMRQCLGLFLPPVTHGLGLTAADFTFAIAIQNIAWGILQAPIGSFADKYGIGRAVLCGVLLYMAAMVVMALANGIAMLALSGAMLGVAVACTGSSLAMTAAARASTPERRSFVLGAVSAFSSVGTLVIAPVLQLLLAHWNWRFGVVLFLALTLAMVPFAFMTGRVDRLPQPTARRATFGEALQLAMGSRRFLVLCCTYFVCGLNLVFINTHLPNYLALCGQDPMLAANALAIIGGVNIVGSWLAGWLGGIYPKHILLGLIFLLRSAVIGTYFMFPPGEETTLIFAAAMGMIWLGVIPLVSGFVAELFGTGTMATMLGLSFVVHQAGSVLGAWGGGVIFTHFGSYDLAWRFGATAGAMAGVALIMFGGERMPGIRRRAEVVV
jgi:MFS family permease